MRKILALFIFSAVTLAGCTLHSKPQTSDSYYCQHIIRQMHQAPHRYKDVGGNKHLPTIQAKLQKEYRHYNCHQ